MKTKKILSLLVVLTLVLSFFTMGIVQAAEDKFAILRTLGINTDFSDDTTPITRFQLAEIAMELTGTVPVADGEPAYPDIPVKHKYFPIINAVTIEGLMGATADGSFSPDAPASAMDGGRVLLAELGYTAFAVQAGWTDAQYSSKVQSLGLLSGVDSSDGLTYYDIGTMMVNMLTTKVMEIVAVNSEGIVFKESNLSYVEYEYGYKIKTGVLQANGAASIAGYATVKDKQAVIDGAIYKTNGQDFSDYVGYSVKVILTSDDADGELIHVEKYSGSAELVINAENINSYNNYTINYTDENEKAESVSFNSNTRVIFNGQNMGAYDENFFVPDHGTVTLVDTDGNDVYDVINISSMIYYKVGGTTAISVSDMWTGESLRLDDANSYVYSNGVGTDILQIMQGEYVEISAGAVTFDEINGNLIMKPDVANSEIITVNVVNTTEVKGVISTKRVDAVGIDNVMYQYNPYYYDLIKSDYVDAVALGSTVTLVLNSKGQVIDIKDVQSAYANSEVPKTYAYMKGIAEARGETGQAIIKIVDLETLEDKSLFTAADCRYNGKKFEYRDAIQIDTTTNTGFYLPDGNFKHQLIRYALNDAGEISELYLAIDHSHTKIKKHAKPLSFVDYIPNGQTQRSRDYVDYYYGEAPNFVDNPDYDPKYQGYDPNNFSLDKSGYPAARHVIDGLYEVKPETLQIQVRVNKGIDGSGAALGNNDAGHYDAFAVLQDTKYWTVKQNVTVKDSNILMSQSMTTAENWNYIELYDVDETFVPAVAIKYISALPQVSGTPITGTGIENHFNANLRFGYVTDINIIYDEATGEEKRQITVQRATTSGVTTENLLPSGQLLESSRLNRRKVEGYTFENDEATYGIAAEADNYMETTSEYAARSWDEIQIGDMIQTNKNTAGEVSGFRIVCEAAIIADADNIEPGRVYRSAWNDEVGYKSVNLGYVIKTNGENGALVNLGGADGTINGLRYLGKLNPIPGGNNSIKGAAMIIHSRTKSCEEASLSDVKVGDYVLIHMNNGTCVEAFIIRP